MSVVSRMHRFLPATAWKRFVWLLLLALAPLSHAFAQPAWPADGDWVFLGADPEEGGLQNDQRDVESLYYTVRDGYLFLRMKNRGPAGWCMVCGQSHLHARYKWLFDTAGNDGVLQGGHIRNSEFLLMVEDFDDNLTGEITFIDSVADDYNTRWDSTNPPRYVTNTPVGAPFVNYQRVVGAIDGSLVNPVPDPNTTPYLGIPQFGVSTEVGYRIFGDDGVASPYSDGIYVDMYIRLALLGPPASPLRLMWLTDQEDENLDQAPCCDRPDDGLFIVIPTTARLTVEKEVPGGNAQDFDFTFTPPPPGMVSNFMLDDDADPTLPATQDFIDLAPGNYSVTELAEAGFELGALTCSNHSGYLGTFTTNVATGTVDMSLVAGTDAHCVYVNVPAAVPGSYNLVVVKSAEPHGPQLFDFTIAGGMVPVNFQLSDPAATSHNEVLAVNTAYTLTEAAVAGWDTTLACDDPAVVVAGSLATLNANTIADGSTVTCTYTNVQRATVTIAKQATEAAPGNFAFTSTLPGAANFNLTSGTQNVVANVTPGTYTVTEAALAGYVLQNIVCNHTTGGSSFVTDLTSGTATLQVAAGANLTCTYINGQLGNLVIVKDAVPNGTQAFAFEIGIGNFSLVDDGAAAGNCAAPGTNTICFPNIAPGDYPTREIVPAGWALGSIVCTGGSAVVDLPTATVTPTVPPGGTVTCTFTNTQSTFTLNVVKDTQPNDPTAFDFSLLRNGNPFANFQLSDPASPSTSFVLPTNSTYVLSEAANAAWNTTVTCSSPAAVVNGAQVTLPPTIAAGTTITCTYENAQLIAGTFSFAVVKDAQPDGPTSFSYTLLENGAPSTTFQLSDPSSPSIALSLTAGSTYVLSEAPVPYWNATVTCSDPGAQVSGAQVTLPAAITAGGSITCTYVNTFVPPAGANVIPALDGWKLWLLALTLAGMGGLWLQRRSST